MKYILLASQGNGVGKSHTATLLKKELEKKGKKSKIVSFADSIRTHLEIIFRHSDVTVNPFVNRYLYNQVKNKPTHYNEDYPSIVLRDLICDYSDVLKKHFGNHFWGLQLYNSTKSLPFDYIIVDDFRTVDEYNALASKKYSEDIYTIFLEKEGYEYKGFNSSSDNYEGALAEFPFEKAFRYTEDYSNSDILIKDLARYVLDRSRGGT